MKIVNEKSIKVAGKDVVIRTPDRDDAQAMIKFIKQADTESEFLLREPGELNLTLDKEKEILDSMRKSKDNIFIAAFDGDKVIANLGFNRSPKYRVNHHGRFGIAVLKEYWGMGIGSELLNMLISWAKENGVIKITLEVDEDNERGLALYEKFGFVEEGKLIMDKRMKDGRYKNTILLGRIDSE